MVAWAVSGFSGSLPRFSGRVIPDANASECWNCDLSDGRVRGLPKPALVVDLSAVAGDVKKAYRLTGPDPGDPVAWLPLPSPHSSVCRSPLANDTSRRVYWTNPGEGAFWNTYARIAAGNTGGNAPYNLGFIAPDPGTVPTLSSSGGTLDGTIPLVERTYLYTFVNEYGEESSPSPPSDIVEGASDGTWTVGNLPMSDPGSPVGKSYPGVVTMRIYRTVVSASSAAQYYLVDEVALASATYDDTIPDGEIVNNSILETQSWAVPPDLLDGLIAMPGGMLLGFTDNTVHFCEPNRPHTWPAGYDQSLQYDIVAMGVWQQNLTVLTKGFPSSGTGASPANFGFTQLQVPEPCIARGSMVTDLTGVYYASQNGLTAINYYGMQNQTAMQFSRKEWLIDFAAEDIVACRHRSQYLAANGTGLGFLIDYSSDKPSVQQLNTFADVDSVWNDSETGTTYMVANRKVYVWDDPAEDGMLFRWRSKEFFAPKAINLGSALVIAGREILGTPAAITAPPLETADALLALADTDHLLFRVFAEDDGAPEGTLTNMVYEKSLTAQHNELRLPSGFKKTVWQFEIAGRVPVSAVIIGETPDDVRNAG